MKREKLPVITMSVFLLLISVAFAAEDTSCVPSLLHCTKFLNGTTDNEVKPDNQCCSALSSVLRSDPQCLCDLITGDFMRQAGIDLSQAMLLPSRCSLKVHPERCGKEKTRGQAPAQASAISSSGINLRPLSPLDVISRAKARVRV